MVIGRVFICIIFSVQENIKSFPKSVIIHGLDNCFQNFKTKELFSDLKNKFDRFLMKSKICFKNSLVLNNFEMVPVVLYTFFWATSLIYFSIKALMLSFIVLSEPMYPWGPFFASCCIFGLHTSNYCLRFSSYSLAPLCDVLDFIKYVLPKLSLVCFSNCFIMWPI